MKPRTADRPFSPAPALSPAERLAADRDLLEADLSDNRDELMQWMRNGGYTMGCLRQRLASRSHAQLRSLVRHTGCALQILD